MKKFIKFSFVFSLIYILFTSSSLAADAWAFDKENGWTPEARSYRGFKIYKRTEDGSSILGIKAEGILKAPIKSLLATLRDVKTSNDWTPNQITKETLANISDIEAITYSLTDMPLWMEDRVLILSNKLMLDKENRLLYVLSNSVKHEKAPQIDNAVTAELRYSNIGMRPISKNETYVEMTVFVDPKGSIPKWVVNFYQKKFPVKFLQKLEKRAVQHELPLLPGIRDMLIELVDFMKLPQKDYL